MSTWWENLSFVWVYAGLLWPIPVLLFLYHRQQHTEPAQKAIYMPTFAAQSVRPMQTLPRSQWLRWTLYLVIWTTSIIATMRPTFYGEPIALPNEGRDLMIAVDLSGSMQTQDMLVADREVDRLVMVKHVLNDFIAQRIGDRLGLILFADTAYLQAPMTFDRNTVATLLDEAVIGLVGESTAIGDAIGLAVKRFQSKPDIEKVLILLTDGQNTAGNISPEQALELAIAEDVTIYPIGVGADVMLVNSLFGQRQVNPSAELDETMLANLAKQTGGRYFRARDTQELRDIYALLNQIEPVVDEAQTIRPQMSLFMYFLAAALLTWLILAALVIAQRKWRWSLAL